MPWAAKINYIDEGTCPKGHFWAGSAGINYLGYRFCRECGRAASNRWNAAQPKKGITSEVKPILLEKETDWAYLAGLLDGEGCLGVYLRSGQHLGKRQLTPSVSYRPRISVSNTNKEVIDWLVQNLGGVISHPKRTENHKTIYHWNLWAASSVLTVCERTLPFLIIKQKQAKLILRWPLNVVANQYTSNQNNFKRFLYLMTLRLNKRGDENSLD